MRIRENTMLRCVIVELAEQEIALAQRLIT